MAIKMTIALKKQPEKRKKSAFRGLENSDDEAISYTAFPLPEDKAACGFMGSSYGPLTSFETGSFLCIIEGAVLPMLHTSYLQEAFFIIDKEILKGTDLKEKRHYFYNFTHGRYRFFIDIDKSAETKDTDTYSVYIYDRMLLKKYRKKAMKVEMNNDI